MNSFFEHIEPVIGFFPFTALMVSGCLWIMFKLTIGMKCHPKLSQHFILWGLLIVSVTNFIYPTWIPDTEMVSLSEEQNEEDYKGASFNINKEGLVLINRPQVDPESTAYDESKDLWNEILAESNSWVCKKNIQHIYHAGIIIVLLCLIIQIIWLETIRNRATYKGMDGNIVVYSSPYSLPFSYKKYIFLPYGMQEENKKYIILHEKSHIKHKHFYLICMLLFIAAFNWYNPFVWLLIAENKILQEMEADSDVMEAGCIPTDYQMDLIRMTLKNKEWIWLKSSFNHHPLKKRILFMNDSINLKQSRVIASLAFIVFLGATTLILGCSADGIGLFLENEYAEGEGNGRFDEKNTLKGCWCLTGTSPDTTCTKITPPQNMCYKLYGDNMVMTIVVNKNENALINTRFIASNSRYSIPTDNTIKEYGKRQRYHLKAKNKMVLTAVFQSPQDGDTNIADRKSEVWERMEQTPENLRKIIENITREDGNEHPFKGTWQLISIANVENTQTIQANPHVYKVYRNDFYLALCAWQNDKYGRDYTFEGHCGPFKYISDDKISELNNELNIEWIDNAHYYLLFSTSTQLLKEKWGRATLPDAYKHIIEKIEPALMP